MKRQRRSTINQRRIKTFVEKWDAAGELLIKGAKRNFTYDFQPGSSFKEDLLVIWRKFLFQMFALVLYLIWIPFLIWLLFAIL